MGLTPSEAENLNLILTGFDLNAAQIKTILEIVSLLVNRAEIEGERKGIIEAKSANSISPLRIIN